MYRFLVSRQWVILTLLGLVLIPVMIKLGFWQLHRHQSRVAHNQLITSSLAARPVPVGRLTGVGREPRTDDQYRSVTATGRYDAAHEVVVRQRTGADGQSIGYFVVTPLVRRDGTAVLVNRGWVEAGGDLTRYPKVPPAPRGEVTVTGRIMRDETSAASGIKERAGLPPRQVMLIDSGQQSRALHRPVLGGYLQLLRTDPPVRGGQPQQIPTPDHTGIGPHMAYAVQWWLFSAAVPVGWVVLVRRERRDRLAAAAEAAESAAAPGAAEPGGTGAGATKPSGGAGEAAAAPERTASTGGTAAEPSSERSSGEHAEQHTAPDAAGTGDPAGSNGAGSTGARSAASR